MQEYRNHQGRFDAPRQIVRATRKSHSRHQPDARQELPLSLARKAPACYASSVLIDDTKLLLRLYVHPIAAMSDILDRGGIFSSGGAVLAISWALGSSAALHFRFFLPLFLLAIFYVPGILLITAAIGRLTGGFTSDFQRDYAPLLTCANFAWAAVNLPLLLVSWFQPRLFSAASGLAYLYFAVLMIFAIRTVFGAGNGAAVATVCLSWSSLIAAYFLWGPLQYLLGLLASPFLLIYVFYYLRGAWGNLGSGLRSRQSFRRNLEAAAINPHDGEAQYQLGLIYQQRRQYPEALRRFSYAIAIDPAQADAHFQAGRIARQQGRLADALRHFQAVVDLDERHSQDEIVRELGALYVSARQFDDARQELLKYEERHPYDPEGLYYHGQALEGLGQSGEARAMYQRAIEAASLSPGYLRRSAAKWSRLAGKQLRRLGQ
jgi:tetratricopeptide (TPR) repeat protein